MNKIGAKIREYRLKRGISRRVLSDGICDESTLFRIEKGLHEPRVSTLIGLCDKLGLPIDHMFHSLESVEAQYIRRVKQLCREYVEQEEFDALQVVLEQEEEKIVSFDRKYIDSTRFIRWQKAILLYRKEKHFFQAKQELEQLLPHKRQLISELDIEIATTLGKLYLRLDQLENALNILQLAFQAARQLPTIERTLYVRTGYNYAKIHFYLQNYDAVITILEEALVYISMNHLLYMNGQLHQLLGCSFERQEKFEDGERHVKKALSYFQTEFKTNLYLRELLALVEIQYKAGKKEEANKSLSVLEDQFKKNKIPPDFLKQAQKVKRKYKCLIS